MSRRPNLDGSEYAPLGRDDRSASPDHPAPRQEGGGPVAQMRTRYSTKPAVLPVEAEHTPREPPKVFSDSDPHPKSQTVVEFATQVRSVAYAPDGNSFAMADTTGKRVRIFRYLDREVPKGMDRVAEDAVQWCEWSLDGRCYGLAYSPDGKLLATANYETNNASIWDMGSAEKDRPPVRMAFTEKGHHTAGVHTVAFSPDSTRLVTGSWDFTARVWDAKSGAPALREDNLGSGHTNSSADAKDTGKRGEADLVVLKGHDMRVVSVAYAPPRCEGDPSSAPAIIATASCDGTVKTWEAETGDLLHTYRTHTEKPHKDEFPTVVFAPDSSTFAANSDNGSVKVFSLTSERTNKGVECSDLSNRLGPLNAYGFQRRQGKLNKAFNLAPGKEGGEKQNLSDIIRVSSIAFSADGCLLATGHADSVIRLWDLALGEVVQVFRGHTKGEVWAMAFDPSSSWSRSQGLLTGGADGTARVWNTFSHGCCAGECTREVRSTDSTTVKTGDVIDGVRTKTMPAHDKDVTKVAYAPDGDSFISVGFDNAVRIWENATKPDEQDQWRGARVTEEIRTDGQVMAAAWTHPEQFAAGFASEVKVWSREGKELCTLTDPDQARDQDRRVFALAYHPREPQLLASGHADEWVRIWDVGTGKLVRKLGGSKEAPDQLIREGGGIVGAVAWFSGASGDKIATGCSGGPSKSAVRIWDSSTGQLLQESTQSRTEGHGFHIKSLAFAPAGGLLISGSEDFTAIVWKLGEPGTVLVEQLRLGHRSFPPNSDPEKGHVGNVFHVGFAYERIDATPTEAITGSADHAIKIWALQGAKDEGTAGTCLRTIWLSGPASCLSFWPRGDGSYDPHCFIATSGKSIFKIDTSREDCPTLSPRDLQQFVIQPDLRDKKWERTKDYLARISGGKGVLDNSGCLLQRITRRGETGLHESVKEGNIELAKVLCRARGGSTSVVLGMDFFGNTPWSIAMARKCIRESQLDGMSATTLQQEATKRNIDWVSERLDAKQLRDRLRPECTIEAYTEDVSELEFEQCLRGVKGGVFPFVGAIKSDPSMGRSDETPTYAHKSMLLTFVDHSAIFSDAKGFKIFDNSVARHLVSTQWDSHARAWFQQECVLYLVLVLCYTSAACMSQTVCDAESLNVTMTGFVASVVDRDTHMDIIFGVAGVSILLLLRFIVKFFVLIVARNRIATQNGDSNTALNRNNILQGISYLLGLLSACTHTLNVAFLEEDWWAGGVGMCVGAMQEVHAAAGGCLWVGMLFYMRGFTHTEAAVPIIQRVLVDVFPYFLVLGTILIGCALVFMNLQRRMMMQMTDDVLRKYDTAQSSLLSSFSMMMGGFEITDFALSSESIYVFVLFMVIVQLVMLNMLIAIMGDSVAQVQEDQKAAGLCSRAQLILNCQDSSSKSAISMTRVLKKWLKCQRCDSTSDCQNTEKFLALPDIIEADQWSGVVDQVKQEIKQQKIQQGLEMDNVRTKIELMQHSIDTKMESIEQKLQMLIQERFPEERPSSPLSSPSG